MRRLGAFFWFKFLNYIIYIFLGGGVSEILIFFGGYEDFVWIFLGGHDKIGLVLGVSSCVAKNSNVFWVLDIPDFFGGKR